MTLHTHNVTDTYPHVTNVFPVVHMSQTPLIWMSFIHIWLDVSPHTHTRKCHLHISTCDKRHFSIYPLVTCTIHSNVMYPHVTPNKHVYTHTLTLTHIHLHICTHIYQIAGRRRRRGGWRRCGSWPSRGIRWLIHMFDMTRHDSFMCVTWLSHECDMTQSWVWHDSVMCVTWLSHVCDMSRHVCDTT